MSAELEDRGGGKFPEMDENSEHIFRIAPTPAFLMLATISAAPAIWQLFKAAH